ncbi:MAG: DUF4332 domain-containing protein [Acidimicrobiales bacterium]
MDNDTHRLRGIGPVYRDVLEEIGVDSVKELSHRRADNLYKTIQERRGTVAGLSEKKLQGWIDQARAANKR